MRKLGSKEYLGIQLISMKNYCPIVCTCFDTSYDETNKLVCGYSYFKMTYLTLNNSKTTMS